MSLWDFRKLASAGPSKSNEQSAQLTSLQHFRQTFHIIKRLGSGDNGDAYAAVNKRQARLVSLKHLGLKTASYFQDLRSRVVAVKFGKDRGERPENDLANEIRMLTQTLRVSSSLYTSAVDAFIDGPVQWLALPFIPGCSLEDFVDEHPLGLNLGFRWHVDGSIAEAALFVNYGLTSSSDFSNTAPAPGWPRVTHGDLFLCNLLLDPRGGYAGYPRVVIADFGRSEQYNDDSTSLARYAEEQAHDIRTIGGDFYDLASAWRTRVECTCPNCDYHEVELDDWTQEFENFSSPDERTVAEVPGKAISLLQRFSFVARLNCHVYYRQLPQATHDDLHKVRISDQQLAAGIDERRSSA